MPSLFKLLSKSSLRWQAILCRLLEEAFLALLCTSSLDLRYLNFRSNLETPSSPLLPAAFPTLGSVLFYYNIAVLQVVLEHNQLSSSKNSARETQCSYRRHCSLQMFRSKSKSTLVFLCRSWLTSEDVKSQEDTPAFHQVTQ